MTAKLKKQIILFKTGSLTPDAKAVLEENGYVTVEMDEPNNVKFLLPPMAGLCSENLSKKVLGILVENESRQAAFGKAVIQELLGK